MSTKTNTIYTCTNCDAQSTKWLGQCFECNKWGTLIEEPPTTSSHNAKPGKTFTTKPLVSFSEESHIRQKTNINEIDRVLGGGVVPGAVMLLAGEPGIGKSTLILHIADTLATKNKHVLYVSGEESGPQVSGRLRRLNIKNEHILFSEHTIAENIAATIAKELPNCVIVDSIQTIRSQASDTLEGSITQVRAAAGIITQAAKQHNIPVFLIGHVNKEGSIAGPKTLEHLIDALFVLEGERSDTLRILRAMKNRFGPVDEIGLFRMEEQGLREISNPSELLLEERSHNIAGSVITATMEGTRPLLVEIQALVTKTQFGYPQRKASGFDINRLQIICAILSKRMNLPLDSHDIFLNVSGGITIRERSADLAVATAIISAYNDKPVSSSIVTLGELGLSGEIRSISHAEKRINEAARLGFTHALVPKKHNAIQSTCACVGIENISQVIKKLSSH